MKVAKTSDYNTGNKGIEAQVRRQQRDLELIFTCLQGRVRFGTGSDGARGENIMGEFQVISDTGAANTEFAVTHTLGSVPIGYLVTKNSKAGTVYDGTSSWTSTTLYLRHEAANANITVFILQ